MQVGSFMLLIHRFSLVHNIDTHYRWSRFCN
nr:MAG TPA: protein of unknown function (DUF4549) [Caudoviricetes sp.]DAO79060.1 MAG TPA: protein of unknown function (DUF4549) [Caudoviricetes sp.]